MNLDALGGIARTALRRWRMPRPRLGYIGWVGRGNLGDDAMHRAAAKLAGSAPELLQTVQREQALGWLGASGPGCFSHTFLGGGTLINTGYLPIARECLRQGMALATLGTGIGSAGFSMQNEAIDPAWLDTLSHFSHVGLRGPVSLEKLRAAGFAGGEVVGDLALALTPNRPVADWNAHRFLFNVAPIRLAGDSAGFAALHTGLVRFLRHMAAIGWAVQPVAFDPDDHAIIAQILAEAGIVGVPVVQPSGPEEYYAIAAGAAFSVGVRLHSAVFAASAGLPNILIGYRDKCRDFAATVGMEKQVIALDRFDEAQFFGCLETILSERASEGARLHAACLGWRDKLENYIHRVTAG